MCTQHVACGNPMAIAVAGIVGGSDRGGRNGHPHWQALGVEDRREQFLPRTRVPSEKLRSRTRLTRTAHTPLKRWCLSPYTDRPGPTVPRTGCEIKSSLAREVLSQDTRLQDTGSQDTGHKQVVLYLPFAQLTGLTRECCLVRLLSWRLQSYTQKGSLDPHATVRLTLVLSSGQLWESGKKS